MIATIRFEGRGIVRGTKMQNTHVMTGTLSNGNHIALDGTLPWLEAKVSVVVEPLQSEVARSYSEVMAAIRQRQQSRGHQPPSRGEVDAAIQAERDSWES